MENASLSFKALEARINAMSDGPASVLDTPRALTAFNVLGTAGTIIGILPFLLIQFMPAEQWMVGMARVGVWTAILGYLPTFVRSIWVLGREFWLWKPKLAEQSDHDLNQFRALRRWLRKFPSEDLKDHHRFAKLSQERLSAKLGLLQGGFNKLGVLPALLAVLVLLRSADNLSVDTLLEVPYWQSWLAIIFVIIYFISLLAVRMRLRLQLYEVVLRDALELERGTKER
ncbi:hypothetical protein [Lysobacter sp. M15]|uniref:hypothetical protein n=1 Tax=Lysobacter sp. M15 TaxID=2916837 RepID=UPI001F57324F|nr:hypothetical protein [Lysobacter sp. M15]